MSYCADPRRSRCIWSSTPACITFLHRDRRSGLGDRARLRAAQPASLLPAASRCALRSDRSASAALPRASVAARWTDSVLLVRDAPSAPQSALVAASAWLIPLGCCSRSATLAAYQLLRNWLTIAWESSRPLSSSVPCGPPRPLLLRRAAQRGAFAAAVIESVCAAKRGLRIPFPEPRARLTLPTMLGACFIRRPDRLTEGGHDGVMISSRRSPQHCRGRLGPFGCPQLLPGAVGAVSIDLLAGQVATAAPQNRRTLCDNRMIRRAARKHR